VTGHLAVIDMQRAFAEPTSRWAAPRFAEVPVRAIDTTGAGDAPAGVFVAGLLTGHSATDAARTANAAAAWSVTVRGPATAPTAAELAAFPHVTR
jgi:sugar/nucleoside kinase (ribokinase family)